MRLSTYAVIVTPIVTLVGGFTGSDLLAGGHVVAFITHTPAEVSAAMRVLPGATFMRPH
ncbi:hypothetical protein ABZ297_19435 [Nonomuraea sp. NPDC005983]|uniref:hypothetical protein n=1 Tax=Nonomuraea sp. NPDC005983 TaxID=3155595 RepID=UPI0033AA4E16